MKKKSSILCLGCMLAMSLLFTSTGKASETETILDLDTIECETENGINGLVVTDQYDVSYVAGAANLSVKKDAVYYKELKVECGEYVSLYLKQLLSDGTSIEFDQKDYNPFTVTVLDGQAPASVTYGLYNGFGGIYTEDSIRGAISNGFYRFRFDETGKYLINYGGDSVIIEVQPPYVALRDELPTVNDITKGYKNATIVSADATETKDTFYLVANRDLASIEKNADGNPNLCKWSDETGRYESYVFSNTTVTKLPDIGDYEVWKYQVNRDYELATMLQIFYNYSDNTNTIVKGMKNYHLEYSRLETSQPDTTPSQEPSVQPSILPSVLPSVQPSSAPSTNPSVVPTVSPAPETITAPKQVSISKVKSGTKKLTITVKKISDTVNGYEVQVATDKNFKKNAKKVSVTGSKTLSKTVKGLKSGKKYFIRVRTYKKANGNKVYSAWKKYSKAVKVK